MFSRIWWPIESDRRLAPTGDALREEDGAHADRLGAVLPRQAYGLRALGRLDLEAHRHDAVLDTAVDLVPGVGEDGEHLAVLQEHLGDELADTQLLRDHGEVLEEDRPHSAALEGVGVLKATSAERLSRRS